jgi:hypothetical protein
VYCCCSDVANWYNSVSPAFNKLPLDMFFFQLAQLLAGILFEIHPSRYTVVPISFGPFLFPAHIGEGID